MDLSIIIPTKDRGEIFLKTLNNACKAVSGLKAEIIVVNDSKTSTLELEPFYQSRVRIYNNPKSGVASARNFGALYAAGKLLLFLDDDMLIFPNNIQITLNLHQTYKNCCINLNWVYPSESLERIKKTQFGRYLIYTGFTSLKGWNKGEYWNDNQLFATNGITSQYLSMEKAIFKSVGGYNENFPHAGFEDFEFAQRLKKKGIIFYIYPLSMVYHNEEDRLQIKSWLARKKRGGETRKVAVEMGYKEVAIQHKFFKKKLYNLLIYIQPLIKALLMLIPNSKKFDLIYFRLINVLLGTAISEGYQKKYL